ncbi:MAG: hypothetical protein KF812_07685 [Fimbriimonadaceae bacterium]|nr:hypothetical protein [Fimbriimonadaceae bacterium]
MAAISSAAKVTLTMGPAPLGAILQSIGEQTNENYAVSEELRSDYLVIAVKNVESAELLARIAEVTEATWRIQGEQAILSPDTRKARERAQAAVDKRLSELQKSLDKFIANSDEETTGYQLLAQLIHSQSKQTLERMVTGRTVLSTNANRLQIRLSGDVRPLVNQMVSETNQRASEAGNAMSQMAEMGPLLNMYRALGMDPEAMFPKPITTEPAKLIVVFDPDSNRYGSGMTATAMLADAEQNILGSVMLPIGGYLEEAIAEPGTTDNETVLESDQSPRDAARERLMRTLRDPDAAITISEKTSKLLVLMRRGNSPATALAPLAEDEEALMSRPDLNDPLGFGVKDVFDVLATESTNQIVGLIPDDVFVNFGFESETPTLVNSLLAWQTYTEFAVSDGWTLVSPIDLDASRANRIHRPALAALIESGIQNGSPRLDAWADYVRAGGLKESGPSAIEGLYLNVLLGYADGFGSNVNPNALRVWAYLQDGQRASVRQGQAVRLSNLNGAAMDAIYKWMLQPGSLSKARTEPAPGGSRILGMMMSGMQGGMFGLTGTLWQEPTELLAGGLGDQAVLGALISEEPFVRPVSLDDRPLSAFPAMGPEEYAFFSELFNGPLASEVTFPNRFELGDRTMLEFIIKPVPGWEMRGYLSDMKARPGRPTFGRGELPKEFLDGVDAAAESFKKLGLMEFFRMMGEGGMGGPEQVGP